MTKDELIYRQLQEDARVYGVLFLVLVVATAAAVILAISAVVTGRPEGFFVFLPFAVGLGGSGISMRMRSAAAAGALKEIGENAVGLDQYHNYSKSTMSALRNAQHTVKEYRQLWIAYGICALMMIVGGVFLLVILWGDEPALLALGGLLAGGGVLLMILAVQSFRSWRMAKRIETLPAER